MNLTFGEYVRQKRLERHLTLRSFAKLTGLSGTFVSGMENSEKKAPSAEVLKTMAMVLKLTKEEMDKLSELATKTKESQGLTLDALQENLVIKIALRSVRNIGATDEEWKDFMRRLKANRDWGDADG